MALGTFDEWPFHPTIVAWRRPMTAAVLAHTVRMMANFAVPPRRDAMLRGEW